MATNNNRYICIHGHFYQPPRENAWLEVVETQSSAAPWHDWNARINYECYAPNAAARILNSDDAIIDIINNYSRISYNFGPTLLSWLEVADPKTYQRIIEADKLSMARFGGHGSAMAQVHAHLILPLTNERDKVTQVRWGMRDFEYRFGRAAKGMWLSETAADTDTLEVLAAEGIEYTILAPRQAKAIRPLGSDNWTQLTPESIDPRQAYKCMLPSGNSIDLFFYDGIVAKGVAFEGLLNNGKAFAHRLASTFLDNDRPQLVHIATDGESYGHHHRYGEMALADCLRHIEKNGLATLTNYAQYRQLHPPVMEVQIHEDSSWSCVHGVERWRSNCGCNTGGRSGWTQAWRSPLRDTLNWLRDILIPIYEKEAGKYLKSPWDARDAYIDILLDRRPSIVQAFLAEQAKKELSPTLVSKTLRLLEMQRHAMLMFTSCGWFFDEISGLETNQILQYANRAIRYAKQVSGIDLHPEFVARLEKAPSNVHPTGATSYLQHVAPAQVNLKRVGMHYAASTLLQDYPKHLSFFNYTIEQEDQQHFRAGNHQLIFGRVKITSQITYSEQLFNFGLLYLGQQNIIGHSAFDMSEATYQEMGAAVRDAFNNKELADVLALLNQYFGEDRFTFSQLFHDEKQKFSQVIAESSMEEAAQSFRKVYRNNYQLMRSMKKELVSIPAVYLSAVEFVMNRELLDLFTKDETINLRQLQQIKEEFKRWDLRLTQASSFRLAASERIFQKLKHLDAENGSLADLSRLVEVLECLSDMNIAPEYWKSQNLYFALLDGYRKNEWVFASQEWKDAFLRLGKLLRVSTAQTEASLN